MRWREGGIRKGSVREGVSLAGAACFTGRRSPVRPAQRWTRSGS